MIIAIIIALALATLIVIACCKISGECSREEEKRDGY